MKVRRVRASPDDEQSATPEDAVVSQRHNARWSRRQLALDRKWSQRGECNRTLSTHTHHIITARESRKSRLNVFVFIEEIPVQQLDFNLDNEVSRLKIQPCAR